MHLFLICMKILIVFFFSSNPFRKRWTECWPYFLFPPRQLHQERRGFEDKCFGLSVRRQRQVDKNNKKKSKFAVQCLVWKEFFSCLTNSFVFQSHNNINNNLHLSLFSFFDILFIDLKSKRNEFDYLDVKVPNQFPSFRPYQRNWYSYKTQPSIAASIKPIRPRKSHDDLTSLPSISSIPNLEASDGSITQQPTMLTVA